MKRLRIVGLLLLALFALGAFAASMASAEEGVLPAETSTGEGGKGALETLSGESIKCTKVSIKEAKFLEKSDQHGTAKLEFSGCKAFALFTEVPANSLGDASEVILSNILYLICLVEPKTLVFGILIQPTATEHIEIPSLKALALVKGAVIAKKEGAELAGKEFKFSLKGKGGDQTEALSCEINGKKFSHSFESGLDSGSDEHASEEAKFTLKFPKEVKLEDS